MVEIFEKELPVDEKEYIMGYLPLDALHNLIKANLTTYEIDFILYLAQYLDADDKIRGVHYKDITENLKWEDQHWCKQSFYNIKNSLVSKGIIKIDRESDVDYDITFCFGSSFSYIHAKNTGYVNSRLDILHSTEFRKLPAYCKMIALDLLVHVNQAPWVISVNTFFEKYGENKDNIMPGKLTVKTLKEYIRKLKNVFYVNKTVRGNYTFALRSFSPDEKRKADVHTSDNELWTQKMVRNLCHRYKIVGCNKKTIKDAAGLITQYQAIAMRNLLSICSVFAEAFENMVCNYQPVLYPARLNSIIGELLYAYTNGAYVPPRKRNV